MGLFDKAKKLATDNADKLADGVDKATDVIDQKTGRKFSSQLRQVDAAADRLADKADDAATDG